MKDYYEIKPKKNETKIKIGDYSIILKVSGAGLDLAISKMQRKEKFLTKKIEILEENAKTKEDFDEIEQAISEYDEIELKMTEIIRSYFKGMDEKSQKWLDKLSVTELSTLITTIAEKDNNGDAQS